MGLLSEITSAVQDYPHEYLTIEIIEVEPPGDVVDVDDDVRFRIQVSNSGPLHVDDLDLLVEGLHETQVKSGGAIAQYDDSFTTGAGWFPRVPAHSAAEPVEMPGSDFWFTVSRAWAREKTLVRVSVAGWNSSFDHIFGGHTREDAAALGVYSSTVSAA